jgi:transposase
MLRAEDRNPPRSACWRARRSDLRPRRWHTTPNLVMPKNITPIWLPSRAPELNPAKNTWQYLRANWPSNRVFETYDAIIDAACDAWRKLIALPETITPIGTLAGHVGQD